MNRSIGVAVTTISLAVLSQLATSDLEGAVPKSGAPKPTKTVDRITQIASFERLNRGGYDGTTTVSQVQKVADFGIGTLTGLDGEMIMLGGVVYQAGSSGTVRTATPGEFVPFATLTRFRGEQYFASSSTLPDYPSLQAFLSSKMPDQDQILAIKLRGTFSSLRVRAPQKQTQPYPPLAEALKTQAVFDLTDVAGTFVGFRFPAYVGTINAPGYHFHFISDDRKSGGHVLEVKSEKFTAYVETIEQYDVTLSPAD